MRGAGGILLIGLAVVLIAASVSGRLEDIWAALRGEAGGGGSGNGTPLPAPPAEGPSETKCRAGQWLVTLMNGERQCYNQGDIASPEKGPDGLDNVCRQGWEVGTHQQADKPVNVCVKRMTGEGGAPGAGYGVSRNLVTLPTGFTGFRNAPNV